MVLLRTILLLSCHLQLVLVLGSQLEQAVIDALRQHSPSNQQRKIYLLIESIIHQEARFGHRQMDFIERILRPPLTDEVVIQFRINIAHPSAHILLLVDGIPPFQQFLENWTDQRYNPNGYYWIVLLDNISPAQVHGMLESLWHQQIVNVIIFTEHVTGQVELFTYRTYSPSVCGSVEPTLINVSAHDPFEDRASNFWGCPLKVGAFENLPFIEIVESNGSSYLRGFEGMLVNLLAERLNFTVEIVTPPDRKQWGFLLKNGSSSGLWKLISDRAVHFGVSSLGYTEERQEFLAPGTPHYYTYQVFAVPSGRPYSAFEKLFLPFHWTAWCAVFFTIGIAWTTMVIVNIQPNWIKNFIYGRGIRSPITNLVNILLGGALARKPAGTFARTLLAFWIIYAHIIRTAYQSSLFKYLQEPKNYSAPLTLIEMIDEKLYYYVLDIGIYVFSDSPQILSRARVFPHDQGQFAAKIEQLGRDELDGALLVLYEHIAHHNKFYPSDQFIQVAKDIVSGFPISIYYPKHTFLRDVINRQVQLIVPAGLIQSWARMYGDYDFYHRRRGLSVVNSLTVWHLIGVFEILAVLETVAILMFLVELLAGRMRGPVATAVDWLERD